MIAMRERERRRERLDSDEKVAEKRRGREAERQTAANEQLKRVVIFNS